MLQCKSTITLKKGENFVRRIWSGSCKWSRIQSHTKKPIQVVNEYDCVRARIHASRRKEEKVFRKCVISWCKRLRCKDTTIEWRIRNIVIITRYDCMPCFIPHFKILRSYFWFKKRFHTLLTITSCSRCNDNKLLH
jgi:hypothetical protein